MAPESFGASLLRRNYNSLSVVTAAQVCRSRLDVPRALQREVRDPGLETWFVNETSKRLASLPSGLSPKDRQNALEMGNRYPDGSMRPISLNDLLQMRSFLLSPQDIIDRAAQGVELLKNNPLKPDLGTVARGIPGGGASSRAAKWARQNPELAARFGITETTPRFLYRVGGRTLAQLTLDNSRHIAGQLGRVFPNIIMTNSEIVGSLMQVARSEWGNFKTAEKENTVFFNQVVMPRMWVADQSLVAGQLFPAGHGDFPYLLAKYKMGQALRENGVKYLLFSNADEWMWQADPVVVSIADELFRRGHHMVIIGVENTNNQFGGGFVRKSDGVQSLVETPRLPWEIVKGGKAPIALNTTFYAIDVDYLAANEARLMRVEKSLAVKEVPGRLPGSVEQIIGVDSWAGDVFADILNPAFIQWPRLNFLGIKDGSFVTGNRAEAALGGRTALHYVNESAAVYPAVISRLMAGDRRAAETLFNNGYSYLCPVI